LLVRAFGLCALLDDFVVRRTEQACVELVEGEILEGKLTPEAPGSMEHYLTVISKKTASLFALACELGAHQAQASADAKAAMRSFGLNAGIAFQIVDDILDITADEDLLGKPSGTDLKQRSPSLINILWLASGDQRAFEFFAKPSPSLEESQIARDYLRESQIVVTAREHAKHYAGLASQALMSQASQANDAVTLKRLSALVEYTLSRVL
jgi:octaprenyl-diphosphate synthase